MWKKLFILSLSVAVFLFLVVPITPADAGEKGKKINWRVAGSIIDDKTFATPEDWYLLHLKAVGAPGRADLTVMGYAVDVTKLNPPKEPRAGCIMEFQFIEDYCSAVFNDLSMLFAELNADGDSYVCLEPDYTKNGKFEMNITGGTGRFEGASGYFNCDIVSHSHYLGGPLGAQSGKFKGMITFED